jgi:uncharacterized Tic20 family protein
MNNVTATADDTRGSMTSKPAEPGPGPRFARSQGARRPGPDPRLARNKSGDPSLAPRIPLAEARPAMFGYLAAIFLGPLIPLVLYMIARRRSPFRRFHAVTALNLSLTGLLYALCCLILCGMLLLDSLTVALVVGIPVALVLWLSVLKYLIRGIGAANRGERYEVPAWICARIAKP